MRALTERFLIPHYRFACYPPRQALNGSDALRFVFILFSTLGSNVICNIHSTLSLSDCRGKRNERKTSPKWSRKRFSFPCFMHEAILKYDHESGEKREISWLLVRKHVCGELVWMGAAKNFSDLLLLSTKRCFGSFSVLQ